MYKFEDFIKILKKRCNYLEPFGKYLCNTNSAIRFGMTMKAFNKSAVSQTKSREAMPPTKIMTRYTRIYPMPLPFGYKYSMALLPK